MRYLYAVLITLVCLVVSFAVYAFMCWILGLRLTQADFTFVLVMNLMIQFYSDVLKRIDKER